MFGKSGAAVTIDMKNSARKNPMVPVAELPQAERERLVALFEAGRYAELEQQANSLLAGYPGSGIAWKVLATSLLMQGKDALDALRMAAGLLPGDADISNNLGNVLKGRGQFEEALACYRKALSSKPDFAEAYYNLGCALEELRRHGDAAENLSRAVAIKPDFAAAHYNLGNCLRGMGRLEAAASSYHGALDIFPDFAEAWCNLGVVLQDLGESDDSLEGRYEEAAGCMCRAIAIKPDYAEAHYNLGNCLRKQGRLNEAVASYRRALEIDPDYSGAWCNLGVALKNLGEQEGAIASCRRALFLKPDSPDMHSNLLFTLNNYAELYEGEISAACREYERRFGGWDGRRHSNAASPERRLRVAYVSPDFRRHAVAYFAEPILANHDRSQVEVYCYAEVAREDDYTERFRGLTDHWRSTVGLSDEAVAEKIRQDRIDILIDLAGHTAGNRLPVFGRKPAPVQITYLGFAGSSGLSAMDYRLTDRYADPEGTEGRYTEKLLRLPYSLWCYRPGPDMPDVTVLPAQKRGYLTFGSFNNFNKLDQETMDLWAALLRAIADSRLMMLTVPEGEARQRLLKEFAARGIDAQRLELHGSLPMDAFHRKFLEADIALDPVNVNGGTTTCEALWMGLPVLSLTGKRFLSRAGLSILSTVGMADFAAATPEAYLQVASYLNENRDLLAEIRANLRGFVVASPLTDEAGFTRTLEGVYRQVWREWCAAA